MEPFTGKSIAGQTIKLDAHLESPSLTLIKKIDVPPATTDQQGHFKFNVSADQQGVIKAWIIFEGSQTHYPSVSIWVLRASISHYSRVR